MNRDVERGPVIKWDQDRSRRTVSFSGEITSRSVDCLRSAIVDLGDRELVIDLIDVAEIDDSGISVLTDLRRRLAGNRFQVRTGPGGAVSDDLGSGRLAVTS